MKQTAEALAIWNEQLQEIEGQVKADPENGQLWLRYAQFLDRQCDNPVETLRAYQRAQKLNPDKDLRLSIGKALFGVRRDEEGLALLRTVCAEKPTEYGYCMLAQCLIWNDQHDHAIEALKQAIAIDPDFDEAYYYLGNAYCDKKESEQAIQCYREAVRLNPDNDLAWRELGFALLRDDDTLEQGVEILTRIYQKNPRDEGTIMSLAWALWRMQMYEDSLKILGKAIADGAKNPFIAELHADVTAEMNQKKQSNPAE